MRARWAVGGMVVGLLVGLVVGWHQGSSSAEEDLYRVGVTHELETAGLCVDSLRVLAEADPEKARRLLHRRLESSIETLYRFPVSAFEGEAAIPNLELAAARSVEYLEQSASPLAERAGAVRDRLR